MTTFFLEIVILYITIMNNIGVHIHNLFINNYIHIEVHANILLVKYTIKTVRITGTKRQFNYFIYLSLTYKRRRKFKWINNHRTY